MSIKHRQVLDALPSYQPGRTPAEVMRALGIREVGPTGDVVKLSANESPYPPPAAVQAALIDACAAGNRYPDFHKVALIEAIASRHDVDPAQVNVDNGSGSIVRHLCLITSESSDEILHAWRSFPGYGLGATLVGATAVAVPLTEQTHDLDAMRQAVTSHTSIVFICNPNNPSGTTVTAQGLERFVEAIPDDVLVVLDEAYHEYVTDPQSPDGLQFVKKYDNVAVLRTFSKAYGLAGLRIGYSISSVEVADLIRKVVTSFSVSAPAQAAALACLVPEVEADLQERVGYIVAERERVTAGLEAMKIPVIRSQANFIYLPIGARSAPVAGEFEDRGVILRPFGDDGLRMTIGLPADNDRFLSIAADVLQFSVI